MILTGIQNKLSGDLLRRHAATEEPARREVAAVARGRRAHHVLRVEPPL